MSSRPCWITPALTERRERFEFVSGADGKMAKPTIRGMSRPRREMSLRFNALLSRRPSDSATQSCSFSKPNRVFLPQAVSDWSSTEPPTGIPSTTDASDLRGDPEQTDSFTSVDQVNGYCDHTYEKDKKMYGAG